MVAEAAYKERTGKSGIPVGVRDVLIVRMWLEICCVTR